MSMHRQARGGLAGHNRYVRYVHTQSHPAGSSLSSPTVIYPGTNDAAAAGNAVELVNDHGAPRVELVDDGVSGVLGGGVGAGVAVAVEDDEPVADRGVVEQRDVLAAVDPAA